VSISLTLDTKYSNAADDLKLLDMLQRIAEVEVLEDRAIISLICNLDRSSEVMSIAFKVLEELGITIEMLSQGASKVNTTLLTYYTY
jgi:aspartate kinase